MVNTEAIIRHAIQEGIRITLLVNKIDRLILELRIKPTDAYYKIKHTIEEINTFIRLTLCHTRSYRPNWLPCSVVSIQIPSYA